MKSTSGSALASTAAAVFARVLNKLTDIFGKLILFIYQIVHLETGQFYIGRKNLQLKKTKKIGKKAQALQEGKGRKKTKEVKYEESDWITYWSSSKIIHKMVEEQGPQVFKREILEFCNSYGNAMTFYVYICTIIKFIN